MKKNRQQNLREAKPYQSRQGLLPGTRYADIAPQARQILRAFTKRTKRQPYIRAAYFNKQKVFLNLFWRHLTQKVISERAVRLRYLPAALELLEKTRFDPTTRDNPDKKQEVLHRFAGQSKNGDQFYVQIKENRKTDKKHLLSIFPDR